MSGADGAGQPYPRRMRFMLTADQAAKAAGVPASTFLADVGRGHAPRPQRREGDNDLWSLTDLAACYDLDLNDAQRLGVRADIAVLYAQGRDWEESTRRLLAQVTLNHRTAQSMIDRGRRGASPVREGGGSREDVTDTAGVECLVLGNRVPA